jgi:hypothetical protein
MNGLMLEWWHPLGSGFVAPAELLNETVATRIADYLVTGWPPSLSTGDCVAASWLAPPRIAERRASRPVQLSVTTQ